MFCLPTNRRTKSLLATSVIAFTFCVSSSAFANSSLCRNLEDQLTHLAINTSHSLTIRRYRDAISEQKRQLARGHEALNVAGCSQSSRGRSCAKKNRNQKKMMGNLKKLEARLAQLQSATQNTRQHKRILARLNENNCRRSSNPLETIANANIDDSFNSNQRVGGSVSSSNQILDAIRREPDLENEIMRELGLSDPLPTQEFNNYVNVNKSPDTQRNYQFGTGSRRTMCVRTCDGYYFPISYSNTQSDFARDAATCESSCAGTETMLFSHRFPGESSEQMISGDGIPYTNLPNAFVYRDASKPTDPSCTCKGVKTKGFEVLAGHTPQEKQDLASQEQNTKTSVIPGPSQRPDRGLSEEMRANQAGALNLAKVKTLLAPEPAQTKRAKPGEIRVVGPKFFPDQEEAIDLLSPDQN